MLQTAIGMDMTKADNLSSYRNADVAMIEDAEGVTAVNCLEKLTRPCTCLLPMVCLLEYNMIESLVLK